MEGISKDNVYAQSYDYLPFYLKDVVQYQDKENLDFIYVSIMTSYNEKVNDLKSRKSMIPLDHGFVPQDRDLDDIVKKLYIEGNLSEDDILLLAGASTWRRVSDSKLLELMEQNPDEVDYLVRGKGNLLRFPISGRPLNTMSILRSNNFKAVKLTEDEGKKGYVNIGNISLFSVNRYSVGMSRGIYFQPEAKSVKYCGTFYYFEPQSHIWLGCQKERMVFFRNKFDAAVRMFNQISSIITGTDDYETNYYDKQAYVKYIENKEYLKQIPYLSSEDSAVIYKNIKYNELNRDGEIFSKLDEIIKIIDEFIVIGFKTKSYKDKIEIQDNIKNWYLGYPTGPVPFDDNYISKQTGEYLSNTFYAIEDVFDQPICILGKKLDFDIIFLEKMAGKTRVVSEILDTRDRKDSVNNLYWQIT